MNLPSRIAKRAMRHMCKRDADFIHFLILKAAITSPELAFAVVDAFKREVERLTSPPTIPYDMVLRRSLKAAEAAYERGKP